MRKFLQIILFSFLLFGILANVSAQERFVRPVDEGKADKSFAAFRTKLIEAVKKHDKKYLARHSRPEYQSQFRRR